MGNQLDQETLLRDEILRQGRFGLYYLAFENIATREHAVDELITQGAYVHVRRKHINRHGDKYKIHEYIEGRVKIIIIPFYRTIIYYYKDIPVKDWFYENNF